MARGRRKLCRKGSRFPLMQWRRVERLIRKDFSPEQVSGYLNRQSISNASLHSISWTWIVVEWVALRELWRSRRGGSIAQPSPIALLKQN